MKNVDVIMTLLESLLTLYKHLIIVNEVTDFGICDGTFDVQKLENEP